MSIAIFERTLCLLEFVDQLLKPELISLMDDDEEHLIMFWTIREWLL
jgi:hypothetical protein